MPYSVYSCDIYLLYHRYSMVIHKYVPEANAKYSILSIYLLHIGSLVLTYHCEIMPALLG